MSGADEAGDRVGRLADLVGGAVTALSDGPGDAVAEVLFKQAEGDGLQCLASPGWLRAGR